MQKATIELKAYPGVPYAQGKYIGIPKEEGESNEAHEDRVWWDRAHYTKSGECFIPGMAIVKAIQEGCKRAVIKNPDNKAGRMTSAFESSLMPGGDLMLGVSIEDVKADPDYREALMLPSEPGNKTKGTRVKKNLPVFHDWKGTIEVYVLDPKIKREMVERSLEVAGVQVGLGVWRPEKKGLKGRFQWEIKEWIKVVD